MATMKALHIHNYGGNEVLVYDDVPRPQPTADELLIRVRAASVNPIDWKMREGYLRGYVDPPLPMILGSDLAGDVVEVGANVVGFVVGDAVFGMMGDMSKGTQAEYVTMPADNVAHKPASLDYVTAAAAGLAALAAWQTVVETAGLRAGQTVLVHGAAGGVGSFAVQFARVHGARVIATASGSNEELVHSLGADEVIDYTASRFEEQVHDVDIVLDTIGGETQERSWGVLKPGGVMVSLIGFSPASLEMAAARGAHAEMVGAHPDSAQLQRIAELIEAGEVRPVLSRVLPLGEAGQAYELSQSGHARGKIVLLVDKDQE